MSDTAQAYAEGKMNRYVVHVPLRSVQVYMVVANTAKEAAEKVNESPVSDDIEAIEHTVRWHGKASFVRLEEKDI